MEIPSDRLEALLELHRENPEEPFVLFALAKLLADRESFEKSLDYYCQLYRLHPNYTGQYYHWAKCARIFHGIDEALKIIDLGIQACQQYGDQHALAELRNLKSNYLLDSD